MIVISCCCVDYNEHEVCLRVWFSLLFPHISLSLSVCSFVQVSLYDLHQNTKKTHLKQSKSASRDGHRTFCFQKKKTIQIYRLVILSPSSLSCVLSAFPFEDCIGVMQYCKFLLSCTLTAYMIRSKKYGLCI